METAETRGTVPATLKVRGASPRHSFRDYPDGGASAIPMPQTPAAAAQGYGTGRQQPPRGIKRPAGRHWL